MMTHAVASARARKASAAFLRDTLLWCTSVRASIKWLDLKKGARRNGDMLPKRGKSAPGTWLRRRETAGGPAQRCACEERAWQARTRLPKTRITWTWKNRLGRRRKYCRLTLRPYLLEQSCHQRISMSIIPSPNYETFKGTRSWR